MPEANKNGKKKTLTRPTSLEMSLKCKGGLRTIVGEGRVEKGNSHLSVCKENRDGVQTPMPEIWHPPSLHQVTARNHEDCKQEDKQASTQ